MPDTLILKPDIGFKNRLRQTGGDTLSNCYQCATCTAVCKLSPESKPFPRKEMLLAGWGLRDELLADPDVWLCHQCNDCSARCPRGAKPGEVIAAIRSYAFENLAVPAFFGKALSRPVMLPLLLLIPILVIGILLSVHTGMDFTFFNEGEVEYQKFIPHGYIEMLFIGGNVLIFAFAAVGLWRFYRKMQATWRLPSQLGFVSAAIQTAIEILGHSRFGKCDANAFRRLAHFLIFFGFIGAMATAGLALVAMMVFHYGPPIPLSNPIKWLGNLSGLAMVIGLVMVILKRSRSQDSAGKANYGHWLFIWMTLAVAVTGLLTQWLRIAEVPGVAYPIYFVHLVVVFFLLWYAPYSEFGHMFYRTLAMVYARSVGRLPRNS